MNSALGVVMEETSLFVIVNMESVSPACRETWVELNWVELVCSFHDHNNEK